MVNIILSGCNGKMGKMICKCVSERNDCKISAGIDINPECNGDFPVFTSPALCNVDADVIIDFSRPANLDLLLCFAVEKKLPTVLATTGFSEEQIKQIHKTAENIPIFFSANMSLGVNLLIELAKLASNALGKQFDIEIIEKHHNQKVDAPSGTALMIANAISEGKNMRYVYDRHSNVQKRSSDEIGISSIRGGTIVGEHEVIFAGSDEVITLSHTAYSRSIFANGALNAALFLADTKPGLYSMKDLLK
ncbi:MAG: 4-hydroxy-tetrahydrodipicolinate reductase [Oscillospiraceae bacterium]|nr:4-hydroxy-tetrahydrodipicolinate reductase [Oscillospiraceae bacterium]